MSICYFLIREISNRYYNVVDVNLIKYVHNAQRNQNKRVLAWIPLVQEDMDEPKSLVTLLG